VKFDAVDKLGFPFGIVIAYRAGLNNKKRALENYQRPSRKIIGRAFTGASGDNP
jgi:hypothetical protein